MFALLAPAEQPLHRLELTRADRPWEFLSALGTRAALLGNEAGNLEAWVYPLKILRNLQLRFHTQNRVLRADTVARTVSVRPESSTILYTGDTFAVRETLFVPVNEPGAIILIEVETTQPLEVETVFERDFQLEWPASLGGTYAYWDQKLKAFYLGEEQKKFVAVVGSPTSGEINEEYQTNYSSSQESSIYLGPTNQGKETKILVMAGSVNGPAEAVSNYQRLVTHSAILLQQATDYYDAYLNQTVRVELPDAQLQQAYDWSRISVLEGLVNNPFLGTGLIAGYRTSGASQRPGFAWFFGRDSLWTSLALNAEGDFATTRTALDFLSKFQRSDGKMPHEISQGASLVDWFKAYPYAYASADATPLYIIAMNDYVVESGDRRFAQQKWDSLWKAYQFLKSTYDAQGLPQNFGVGHGWVEGGPLLPVKTELYQSSLGTEALRALSNLARLSGKEDLSQQIAQEFAHQRLLVNQVFWSAEKNRFAFALDQDNRQVDEPSVLATVPMWFGLLDESHAQPMINTLAAAEHETDWGMRIISSAAAKYSAGGYHFGSVWPLFTGWAAVGEYRYHRALPAYSNLRANSLLALDGSLGHVTEVLSGDYYQPLSTSSPHQIWSAAMVINALLRGLFGLQPDESQPTLLFAPHVPAGWDWFAIQNVRVGANRLDLRFHKTRYQLVLEVSRHGGEDCTLEFSPAISLRAEVMSADLNGRKLTVTIEKNAEDQHVSVRFPVHAGPNRLHIHLKNDFGLGFSASLPPLGSRSRGLRVISESWTPSHDALELETSGVAGAVYELEVWNPAQITSVEGAELTTTGSEQGRLQVRVPDSAAAYPHERIVLHFSATRRTKAK